LLPSFANDSFVVVAMFNLGFYMVTRKTYKVHLHHYQIFLAFLPLTPFQNCFSAVIQSLSAGIYVEGVARQGVVSFDIHYHRWSMAAHFVPHKNKLVG
jgi:hypothetical protein